MNNVNKSNQSECRHGVKEGNFCSLCAEAGIYFQRDAEVYRAIYAKSSNLSFELAFELFTRIDNWGKATKRIGSKNYFKGIKKCQKILWSENSVRQAYAVAKQFKDLENAEQRKLSFSAYREIANADLSSEKQNEIRKVAEEGKFSFGKIRELVRTELKKEVKEKYLEIEDEVIFYGEEDCLKQFKDFLQRNKSNLKNGVPIKLKFYK
jgi:hypothetical protein